MFDSETAGTKCATPDTSDGGGVACTAPAAIVLCFGLFDEVFLASPFSMSMLSHQVNALVANAPLDSINRPAPRAFKAEAGFP